MHIALVRKNYSLKKAGAERYCVNLSRQLQKLGHQVTVIGETIDAELRDEVRFLPVPVRNTTSWAKNLSFARNAEQIVNNNRFDVVHGLSRTPGVDTFRVTDPLQAHWLQVYYSPTWNWLQHLNPRHRTILQIERSIYQSDRIKRFIVQSRLDAELIQTYYQVPESKIRRVSNGIDLSQFHPGVREVRDLVRRELGLQDQPLLVFAGMDFRRKGLAWLIEALHHVDRRDTRLLVLGSGNVRPYEKLAHRFNVGDRVIFAGRKQSMPRYYGAADLFVLPTIYEPFPNVNLEAMACGVPVITTSTAGGADIVVERENGYLIPKANAVLEMADKINAHLALPSGERDRISVNCWETAQRFPVEQNARDTLRVLEEALLEKSNGQSSRG
ncbi:MAG: glycosyltransferase family 4 protein [Planctomycetales bacterium]